MNLDHYVICVEHDLSVLDYLSDFICCLYGILLKKYNLININRRTIRLWNRYYAIFS